MTTLSRERVQELRDQTANGVYVLSANASRDFVALCDHWLAGRELALRMADANESATDAGEVKRWRSDRDGDMYELRPEQFDNDDTFVREADYSALAAAHRAAVSERDEYKSAWEDDNRDLGKALLECDAALAARDAALKDAERYRWLRENWSEPATSLLHPFDDFAPDPDQLDHAIDTALSQPAEGKSE